jgi:hypothetical protein
MGPQIWRYVPGNALMFLTNLFTAVALIFEGELVPDHAE